MSVFPQNRHPPPAGCRTCYRAGMSTRETQEMLDFCAERAIMSDVEVIPIQQINEAYVRMLRSNVKYRFVIDMASLAAG